MCSSWSRPHVNDEWQPTFLAAQVQTLEDILDSCLISHPQSQLSISLTFTFISWIQKYTSQLNHGTLLQATTVFHLNYCNKLITGPRFFLYILLSRQQPRWFFKIQVISFLFLCSKPFTVFFLTLLRINANVLPMVYKSPLSFIISLTSSPTTVSFITSPATPAFLLFYQHIK